MKRWKVIAIVAGTAVVLALGGYFGGRYIRDSVSGANKNDKPAVKTEEKQPSTQQEATEKPKEPEAYLPTGEAAPETIVIGGSNEVIKTMGNLEYLDYDADNKGVNKPEFYSELDVLGVSEKVYGFLDKNGVIQLRVFGSRWKMENNVKKENVVGFWAVNIQKDKSDNYSLILTGESTPCEDTKDTAAVIKAAEETKPLPAEYVVADSEKKIYSIIDVYTNNMLRAWGKVGERVMLFPCDSMGVIKAGALPVVPEEESKNALHEGEEAKEASPVAIYPVEVEQGIILGAVSK